MVVPAGVGLFGILTSSHRLVGVDVDGADTQPVRAQSGILEVWSPVSPVDATSVVPWAMIASAGGQRLGPRVRTYSERRWRGRS